MRVLVTGGAGYVGSHTVRRLQAAGHDTWVFDNLSTGHPEAVRSSAIVVGDLADRKSLHYALNRTRFDAVIHFAGVATVAESVSDPLAYYRQNVTNTLNLLDALRVFEIRRLVVSSSCAVYGNPDGSPVTEKTMTRPISPYGRSKMIIEQMLADCAAAYGMGSVALRYFNAAGAHADGSLGEDHLPEHHLIPLALQVALGQRSHLKILGTDYATPDGSAIRDYVHVDDLADAHLAALEAVQPGTSDCFNLGSGRGWSVRDVIRICEEVTGETIPVESGARRPGDPAALFADACRAAARLGWSPRYTELEEIIATAWRWHQQHPCGYGSFVPATIPFRVSEPLRAAA